MIARVFHRWERRLASADNNRIVRPFDWGTEWIDDLAAREGDDLIERFGAWALRSVNESDRFFELAPCRDYVLEGQQLSFPSAVTTPHRENNTVRARYFPETSPKGRKRAVIVLPQWNADAGGHVGLVPAARTSSGSPRCGSACRTTTIACRRSSSAPTTS